MARSSYSVEKDVDTDNNEKYRVSAFFYSLTRDEMEEILSQIKSLKGLFDARERVQKMKYTMEIRKK